MRALLAALAVLVSAPAAQACRTDLALKSDFPDSVREFNRADSGIARAWYDGATDRYAHGVLGDAIEPSILSVQGPGITDRCGTQITLDPRHVFEDLAPRLVDLNGDGTAEIITIRSHRNKGAQIAVYGLRNHAVELIATTPYIGTRNRWLAPVGATDLDGDGFVEIAFVDRPHLAKTLRIWRFEGGALQQVASLSGVTNHRIGEDFISGGIRDCDGAPEMLVASANWRNVLAVRFDGRSLEARVLGAFDGPQSFDKALNCS